MVDQYTIKDVTEDLGQLVKLTKLFEVDSEGFWVDGDTPDKRFVHKLDQNDSGKEIVVFQDPLPRGDFYFFNPFAEGLGKKSPAVNLFFKTLRTAFNVDLQRAFLYASEEVLKSKEEKDYSLGHALVRISTVPIDKKSTVHDVIDEKMLTEFETIWKRMDNECIFVPYLHQQMTAKVMVDALTDSKWEEKYTQDIRKKAIGAFRAMLMGILGIKDAAGLEAFTVKYDPDLKSSARLHTTMEVYLKLYNRFNDILPQAWSVDGVVREEQAVDLGELQNILDRMPMAYAIAKHMIQPSIPKNSPVDTSTVDTSKLSFGGNKIARRFPGPEEIDSMGRKVRPGAAEQPVFNRSLDKPRRFQPHVVSEVAADPFAPMTRSDPNNTMSGGFAGNVTGGYFGGQMGNQGGFGYANPSWNFSPASNFGSPSMQRSYFR